MRDAFCGTGLFRAAYSPAKRGDLYLAEGKHVAMCQDGGGDGVYGRDCLTEFNRNENHAASYGKVGDQDGYESVFRGYYDDGWNTVLHYVGGPLDHVTAKEAEDGMQIPMLYDGGDGKVYYWSGDPESVPFHVDGEQKVAIENSVGIRLRKLGKQDADAIMRMCKDRKAWREEGMAEAIRKGGQHE
jgi:hypothetical protein